MVQKTSMSRGPYPPSQEIPMEVFDPSPQVRCGGQAKGRGLLPRTLWDRLGGRWGGRGYVPDTKARGRPCAPHPCRFMIDGRLAWS